MTEHKKHNTVLFSAISTSFLTAFAGSALTLCVPAMGDYFHMGAASVGWIITVYAIGVAAFSVPMGKLADSTSRKNVLLIGVAVFVITSFLSIAASAGWTIIALRALQALGAAMIFATNMPIAIASAPPSKRGQTIGIVTSGVYVGLTLGPVLGGMLNHMWGWKSIFAFAGIIGIFSFAASAAGIEDVQQKDEGSRQDVAGNIIYIIMICAIIYGLTDLNSTSFAWIILAGGLLLAIVFVKVELAASNPMMDVRLFKGNPTFSLSLLTAFFQYSSTFALSYLVSIYLQVVLGFTSQTAGIILISQPLFMAVLSPKVGKLSDRMPAYKLASAGIGLCGISLLFFAFAGRGTHLVIILIALAVAGIGTALFSSPNTNVVMSCVPPSKFGVTNSILSATRTGGQSFCMAIITLIVSSTVGNVSLYEAGADNLLHTMRTGFIIFTALCLSGCLMSLQRRKVS